MTRAESTGLGEESAGPARRTIESTGLGEDSAGPARRKSTEARRREHGSMSSETESAEARRARAKQRGRAMVIRAGPARDLSTYRGARWAVARERSTRASFQHSQVTRERAVEQSQVTHASEQSSSCE